MKSISAESGSRLSRRDFLKLGSEFFKVLLPSVGIAYDIAKSRSSGITHISPGTALGIGLRLGGSVVENSRTDTQIKRDAGELRAMRRIQPFVSDYLPDELDYSFEKRVDFYTKLKELGVTGVRTEFRLGKLMREDGTFDQDVEKSYEESLRAMKQAGLSLSTLVFFSPAEWMIDLAKNDEGKFLRMYRTFIDKCASICDAAGQQPKYVQVMNEVNSPFFNKIGTQMIINMIHVTREAYRTRTDRPKIMTTIITNTVIDTRGSWRKYVENLLKDAEGGLDAVGFDYYFFYDHPVEPFLPQSVFDLYLDKKEVFEWLVDQKQNGVLRDKDILVAEMGMPVFQISDIPIYNEEFARLGYDIYFRALDQILLKWQRLGNKAEDLITHVGIFCGGDHPSVQTYVPGKLDFLPWTLLHFNKETNQWYLTDAAKRLAYLNNTRLNMVK